MEYARSQLEYRRTTSRAGSIVFRSDAGFMSHFKSNSIEDALRHYHDRYKRSYLHAYYVDELGKKHRIENISNSEAGEPDFRIEMNWFNRGYN